MTKELDLGDVVMINKNCEFLHPLCQTNPSNTFGKIVRKNSQVWYKVLWENGEYNLYRLQDLDIHLKIEDATHEVRSMLYPKLFALSTDHGEDNEKI